MFTPQHPQTNDPLQAIMNLQNAFQQLYDIEHPNASLPLHHAIENNHSEDFTHLLSNSNLDEINRNGETPLMVAAINGRVSMTKALLDEGADLNKTNPQEGTDALFYAAAYKHTEVADILIERGANINRLTKDDSSALFAAAFSGNTVLVKNMVAAGANPDIADKMGQTPIFAAANNNEYGVVEFLLSKYDHINYKTCNGDSILDALIRGGSAPIDLIMDVIKHGANVNNTDSIGKTTLHKANSTEATRILLEHGAQINVQDDNGMTPLHLRVRDNEYEAVKLLLEKGADPLLESNNESALHWARKFGHVKMIPLIAQYIPEDKRSSYEPVVVKKPVLKAKGGDDEKGQRYEVSLRFLSMLADDPGLLQYLKGNKTNRIDFEYKEDKHQMGVFEYTGKLLIETSSSTSFLHLITPIALFLRTFPLNEVRDGILSGEIEQLFFYDNKGDATYSVVYKEASSDSVPQPYNP